MRLVGYEEYGKSIALLDQLLRISSLEEIHVIDELISEQNEFAIYTNLSQHLRTGPTSLAETPQNENDRFERRGLAWVLALARVEMAAMLAAFTSHPKPFRAVRPTSYDMDAFKELVLDGARTHFWALSRDPQLERAAIDIPTGKGVLAYSRRLVVARAFGRAAMELDGHHYSQLQQRELVERKKHLDSIQGTIIANIRGYLQNQGAQKVKASSHSTEWANACSRLLRAEQREIASGKARVENFNQ